MSQLVRRSSSIYIHHITKSNAKVLCQILPPLNHSYPNKKLATPTSLLWSFLFLASHSKLTWRIEDKWQSHGWQHGLYIIPGNAKKYQKKHHLCCSIQRSLHKFRFQIHKNPRRACAAAVFVGAFALTWKFPSMTKNYTWYRWRSKSIFHVHTVPYISNIVKIILYKYMCIIMYIIYINVITSRAFIWLHHWITGNIRLDVVMYFSILVNVLHIRLALPKGCHCFCFTPCYLIQDLKLRWVRWVQRKPRIWHSQAIAAHRRCGECQWDCPKPTSFWASLWYCTCSALKLLFQPVFWDPGNIIFVHFRFWHSLSYFVFQTEHEMQCSF